MEEIRTEETPCVMGENNAPVSEGQPNKNKNKKKNKKKKRGQNKKLGIQLQSKNGEPASLNPNKKTNGKKNEEKGKEGGKPDGEENNAMQNKNNQQEKPAKKRRNHRDFTISSAKVDNSKLSFNLMSYKYCMYDLDL